MRKLFLGKTPLWPGRGPVEGETVELLGEPFYKLANYDRLRPFFMSLVSASDHWMFLSSTGGLTAGRRSADQALFPYSTDDKIHDAAETTGSKTLLRVSKPGGEKLWEPFSQRYRGVYPVRCNLYKSFRANQLVFEEKNEDLELSFRYGWFNSERFGFIRRCWLENLGRHPVRVQMLDGIQNLMPSGISSQFQLEKSTLLDAYKKNELSPETGLGLFRLSSVPMDRPEPAEALSTTVAWCAGLVASRHLLCSRQLDAFREGCKIEPERDIRGERGAYFARVDVLVGAGQTRDWLFAADVLHGHSAVADLNQLLVRATRRRLTGPKSLKRLVLEDVRRGTTELARLVASADGLQQSAQPVADARHFSNVLFNIMRGGVFLENYRVNAAELRTFVAEANRDVAARNQPFFRELARRERGGVQPKSGKRAGAPLTQAAVIQMAARTGDRNLERLCREYLPLTFSRRHGDPSRPWNRFTLSTHNPDGTRRLDYEGNWRDIFQNWEALAVSFPGYAASMVCRFANASTPDGYNPYRIMRAGLDWEVPDPSDPWSHIGYWGDHQLIYLLKLLEICDRQEPALLRDFLSRDIFSYANVPYRLKPYEQMLKNPKETVLFDSRAEATIRQRVQEKGSDGKLVWDPSSQVCLVNLTEKLLVSLLAKLSNFIPDAGLWLNTQRPEWNDANNALVGNGVSVVTVCYLRRYLAFCRTLCAEAKANAVPISEEVAALFYSVLRVLKEFEPAIRSSQAQRGGPKSGEASEESSRSQFRRQVLDALGSAGSRYREQIYQQGLSGRKKPVRAGELAEFLEVSLAFVDDSIAANRRPDGLYHAYNLVRFDQSRALPVRRLYEMLEGQVAVLSSGKLSPEESLDVLQSLKRSALYRPDQHSYLLYPDRRLPGFLERNHLPHREVTRSRLLRKLAADGDRRLIERDGAGRFHFSGQLSTRLDVSRVLDELAAKSYQALVKAERARVVQLFEDLFDHQSFTGRSGTFFGYEGLGCIYWHMVSKLLLAAQESFFRAVLAGGRGEAVNALAACYYDIRSGLGDQKPPAEYGAFPMDPYSHTPGQGGARQPGLTGQVKEDILCRQGELGVFVEAEQICFRPWLLKRGEFLKTGSSFEYFDVLGRQQALKLRPGSLAFTYCQVPVVYELARADSLRVVSTQGVRTSSEELRLDRSASRAIFQRTGEVARLELKLRLNRIWPAQG